MVRRELNVKKDHFPFIDAPSILRTAVVVDHGAYQIADGKVSDVWLKQCWRSHIRSQLLFPMRRLSWSCVLKFHKWMLEC